MSAYLVHSSTFGVRYRKAVAAVELYYVVAEIRYTVIAVLLQQ